MNASRTVTGFLVNTIPSELKRILIHSILQSISFTSRGFQIKCEVFGVVTQGRHVVLHQIQDPTLPPNQLGHATKRRDQFFAVGPFSVDDLPEILQFHRKLLQGSVIKAQMGFHL
jgi:hypothetical protein